MDAYNAKRFPQETPMARLHRKLTSQQQEKLVYLFNTAHSLAMHNWSLKDFKPLCDLQVKNGVLMVKTTRTIQVSLISLTALLRSSAKIR